MKNIKGWMMVMLVMCLSSMIQAQNRIEDFNQFRARLAIEEEARNKRIEEFITQKDGQREIPLGNGQMAYIFDVVNGKPLYMATDNNDAAENVGVTALRLGGGLGLNLTGAGLRLVVWDETGGARPTHQEFGDRIIPGSDFAPGGAADHSTHVTGTVIAGGFNADARGMAPEANAVVYNFNNDVNEMTQELADNAATMILSNHSYGPLAGWRFTNGNWAWAGDPDIDENEDWKFGFYDSRARNYDQLMYDFPNYTIVKSAGNHRTDTGDGTRPPDGPYDIIAFQGTAKNIITVGATRKLGANGYEGPESVIISSFTSFGPTDDGRIKPDIAAPGVSVFSPIGTADDSYSSFQGTSMATPVTLGSLSLIQQLNQELTGEFMSSAALKALMIHTAREAGDADGPDYEYGWGLLNAEGMAKFLLEENNDNRDLVYDEIADGETKTYTITPEQGTKVTLSLVWTDLPGTPTNNSLDPETLMLVNDLDMRAVGATETQEPWVMRPEAPTQPADKGDNFRDNVEKIEFTAVDASYTVNITHKETLGEDPQRFALVIEYEKDNAAKTLYWVGNSGAWNDGGNWSLTSGGAAADVVPTAADIVIFDNNSFTGLGDSEEFSVTLSQDVEVAQFRWFAENTGTVDLGGNTITTDGNLVVLSDQVNLNNGTLSMSGDNGDAVVNVQAPVLGSDIVIDSPNDATFQIVGDLEVNSLKLMSGTLNISGSQLSLGEFTLSGGELNVSNSTFTIGTSFAIQDENASVSWSDSEITVASGSTVTINLAGATIPMTINVNGDATISSGAEVTSMVVTGTATVNTDLRLTDIGLAAGATLNIGDGNSLTVANNFDPTGTDGTPVNIASPGTGSLDIENHRKICTDFISVSGVNYTGQATLAIGTNSTLAGNEQGWQLKTCDEVLFANFNFAFGCGDGLTEFENLSSGDVQSNAWNFGETDPSTVDSEEANPTYAYTTVGPVTIKLTVTDSENNSFVLNANTEIIQNTIGGFNIVEQVGFLVSQRAGERYQWYKDDVAIEGETTRQLEASDAGTYKVLVYDGACNRFSEDFRLTVTSIEPDPEEQKKAEEAVNVFPNPTRDYVDVSIEGYVIRNLSMELVDQSGKVVTSAWHENINSQSFTERLKVSDKRQGFYILRFVVNENILINRKVILTD